MFGPKRLAGDSSPRFAHLPREGVALTALALAGGLTLVLFPHFTVDDAFISFRYAANLARSGQLAWNVGLHPVEGYTGIALPLLLAGGIRLGIGPEVLSHAIGVMGLVLAAFAMWRLLVTCRVVPAVRIGTVALFVSTPMVYVHATSGLETTLFLAAVMASCWLYANSVMGPSAPPRHDWGLLVALAVTSLIRPEGAVLAIALGAALFVRRRREQRATSFLAGFAAAVVAPLLAYEAWRLWYYGALLPNTFAAKSGATIIRLDSLHEIAVGILLMLGCPIATVVALRLGSSSPQDVTDNGARHPGRAWVAAPLAAFSFTLVAGYVHAVLIMDYSWRFVMPIYAVGLCVLALLASEPRYGTLTRRLRIALAVVGVLIAMQLSVDAVLFPLQAQWVRDYSSLLREEHVPVSQYLRHTVPQGQWVAVDDAGLIPYTSGVRSLDLLGLNDSVLASSSLDPRAKIDYVLTHDPRDVVLDVPDGAEPFPLEAALVADPRFAASYRLVRRYTDVPFRYQLWVYERNT